MAKHRSNVFTVVREECTDEIGDYYLTPSYTFSTVIGTYLTLQRAEEIAATAAQVFKDAGLLDYEYRFSVRINTYYDE